MAILRGSASNQASSWMPTSGRDQKQHPSTPFSRSPTPLQRDPNSNTTSSDSENQLPDGDESHVGWKERIRHFTWTFFTMTMATGGIANVIHTVPYQFRGLEVIGLIFFLLALVTFLFNILMISLRFYFFPPTFKASFLHPTESLFVPASVVSFGTILINISQYGLSEAGPWLDTAVYVLFWANGALAIISSCGIYLLIWSTQTFTISTMNPLWIFPAYPMLIIGPHAGYVSGTQIPERGANIIIGGVTIQGIGFLFSMMVYAAFINRLMTNKLPKESTRPSMFVSVGPSGFTASGLINMGANAHQVLPKEFMGNGPVAAMILKVTANFVGIIVWGLAVWFFIISVGAHGSCVSHGRMTFSMSWYSFVFPNTALVIATFAVGKAFEAPAIQIVGCVLTVLLIITWIFVFVMMIRAVFLKQILWPQKGEDRDEGGWKSGKSRGELQSYETTENGTK